MPGAARADDTVSGQDTHIVLVPSPSGTTPTPQVLPFNGRLARSLSPDVTVDGRAVAVVGSVAVNQPAHIPIGGTFQKPPSNQGTVQLGSMSVFANGKAVARIGDPVITCNDPVDAPVGRIASGSLGVEVG
jgi:uncharacterized Zn-binding protein involved in type VI secretion